MISSLADITKDIENRIKLSPEDIVVDIGCNDGTLLALYKSKVTQVGYDPALNLKQNHNFLFINNYFSKEEYGLDVKAKVITAIAMFYDLPDPHQFVEDVSEVLHENGIFVIQFTDLLSM